MAKSKNGDTIKDANGKPWLVLPDVPDIEALSRDPRSRMEFVADRLREILQPSHGDRLHIAFVNPQLEGGARISGLLPFGLRVLHWSDLTEKQVKQTREILMRQPDDMCRHGDAVLMVCKEEVYQARRRYVEEQARAREHAMVGNESGAALSTELGVKIEENPKW